ncbi:MAG: trimethylamine methyltransferase family protein, partial [Armatimonadota bacterium]|nr:trimethylamine methyltransferase family protein [Armatimonadota bacterium]MDW8144026.1 trimethylamine methyltransferase family protein [Armatimonadota bacterium]
SGERALLSQNVVEEFVEELRSQGSNGVEGEDGELIVFPSSWSFFYVDPISLEVKPYDKEHLIQFTKLVDSCRGMGVGGGAPGWVQDEPPLMRPIVSYFIQCRYSSISYFPGIAYDIETLKWMKEMAKAMGHEFGIGVETFSPLSFSGNSLDVAIHFSDEVSEVGLDPMPIMGISAPLDWHAAWAQSVAENIGGYILLRLLGFKRVYPSFRLFTGSMRSGLISFGAPEYALILLMRVKIRKFYNIPVGVAESMLTTAKLPDQHAATEKASLTLFAALAGYREFEGAGTLSLDEIFSPQQFIVDLEVRDYIARVIRGIDKVSIKDAIELVQEGLTEGNFLAAPFTTNRWRDVYWRPRLFHQIPLSQWKKEPKRVLDEAWEVAREKIAKHDYELDEDKVRELEAIVQRARKELCG